MGQGWGVGVSAPVVGESNSSQLPRRAERASTQFHCLGPGAWLPLGRAACPTLCQATKDPALMGRGHAQVASGPQQCPPHHFSCVCSLFEPLGGGGGVEEEPLGTILGKSPL